jgi:hypothetical protein
MMYAVLPSGLSATESPRVAPPAPPNPTDLVARSITEKPEWVGAAGCLGVAVMGNLLDREALVGGDGLYDPHRDNHDALSSPGHDLRYELTDAGRDFLKRRRR